MKDRLLRLLSNLRKSAKSADRLLLLLACCVVCTADAAEPFLKEGDVIALVGGEDMVVAGELGYLELLLTRALPGHRLKFRNLAWEGDTVFEQRRDLNFPPLEAQLDQVGATVVLCQFGQMESLAGKEKLPEFVAAYEKLIVRIEGGGKRRAILIPPSMFGWGKNAERETNIGAYGWAVLNFQRMGPTQPDMIGVGGEGASGGMHLTQLGQWNLACTIFHSLGDSEGGLKINAKTGTISDAALESLRQLITAKNRLWFNYWRVENWAFLAGDRTNQPSSRDHLDPGKRWFPAEREAFLPLIAAKEAEIHRLAAELAAPPAHEQK